MARKPRSMRQRTALAMAQRIGGPPSIGPKKRTGPGAWLRYAFDNSLARGTPALVVWLIGATVFLVLCFAVVQFVANLGQEGRSFPEVAFDALLTVIDPSTAEGNGGNWVFLLTLIVLVLGGLFIVSGLIGVIAAGIEGKIVDLRRGRSIVLEAEHTVILGWSESIFTIVREFAVANESRGRTVIAVLADRDKVEMEDELREQGPGAARHPGRLPVRLTVRPRRPGPRATGDRPIGHRPLPRRARRRPRRRIRPRRRGHQDPLGAALDRS